MRLGYLITTCTLACAACGDDAAAGETPVARSFDELAQSITSCAGKLRACDDAGADECRETFYDCREGAGDDALERLVNALGECRKQTDICRDEVDASADACTQTLRACLGEARGQSGNTAGGGGLKPNPNAPTYQCFGMLRECIAGTSAPNECATEARACVVAAVGEPPRGRPEPRTPRVDAGMPDRDAAVADAGTKAGTGGTGGRAGAGGAGSGGKGGAPAAAGAGGSVATPGRTCMDEQEACLGRGEKPMTCMRDLRKCEKAKP